jgi:phenylpyruvate tautomerase PptA (4-oxalocrotonate tautomerase family)
MAIDQCVVPQGTVGAELRPHIADQLARIHCEATGADPAFVQVVFFEVRSGATFNSGQPASLTGIARDTRATRPAGAGADSWRRRRQR